MTTLVLAICTALLLAAAAPASAVTRKQAAKKALAALGAKNAAGPVVVLGLPKPLRAGTAVTQEGKKKVLARVGRERAFFFYQDGAPLQPFPHAGRVALVGVKSGKVKLTRTLSGRPRLNGRLPAFLKSSRAYRDGDYLVYDGSTTTTTADPTPTSAPTAAEPTTQATAFDEIDVPGVNQPPSAHDDFVVAKQDNPKHLVLTGSDPDAAPGGDSGGDLLTFRITKPPNHGTLSGQPPNLTYTPNPGRIGPDHFFFVVNDGQFDSKEGKVTIEVLPRGAAPVVTTSAGCTEYLEQTPGVAVDGSLTVSDSDDTVLDSAVVRIATNFERGDDLLFSDQNGISGSYNDITGELQLVGDATVATYEAALRSVRYQNLGGGSPAATKGVEFTVDDAGGDSAPATKDVCLTEAGGPNNRPIGETSEGALEYIENDGPVSIDPGFVVIDNDSTQLSGASIKFAESKPPEDDEGNPIGSPVNNFAPDEDELAFQDQNGISGNYNDTTGVLTLSGLASVAHYEAAMRSVTYENTSEDPSDAPRAIRLQVTDSSGLSSIPSNRGILITPVNDAPTTTPSEGQSSYTEDEPATPVDAALEVGDVDDDDLEGARVRIASGIQAGDELSFEDQLGITGTYDVDSATLTLSGTATVEDYETALRAVKFRHVGDDPDATARGVEFVVNDGELDSAPSTKEVAVVPVNDAPVATASEGSTAFTEGDPDTAIDAALTVSDVDDDQLEGAQVRIAAGLQSGDALSFSDQLGITSAGYDSETGVLTLTGSAPVADYETALRTVAFSSSNDDPVTSKTIEFVVNDGDADSNAAAKDLSITPVNDAPTATPSEGQSTYTEDEAATPVDSAITVADADDDDLEGAQVRIASGLQAGDELSFEDQLGITSAGYDSETGTLTLSGTASVADYETALRAVAFRHVGDDPDTTARSVEFVVNDGELDSLAAAKEVAVAPVNDAPVVTASGGSTAYTEGDPDTAIDTAVSLADVDDDQLESAQVRIAAGLQAGDALTFADQLGITSAGYDSETGVLTLTGSASLADYETALRAVAFSSANDDPVASKTIEFVVNDGEADSNASAKDISVTPVNDAPIVATSEGSTTYEIGGSAVAVDSQLTVGDPDDSTIESGQVAISGFEAGDQLAFGAQNGISGDYDSETGVLTLTGSASPADYETALRSIEFSTSNEAPAPSRSIEFSVSDGDASSATASKAISLVQPNDPPVVTTSSGNSTYTLGDTTGVEVDNQLTVADSNDASLVSAVVRIQDIQPGDELLFTDQGGISGTIDETGFLVLSGSASVADYQAALRSVRFRNTTVTVDGTRTVEFQVNDGRDDSAVASKGVDLVAPPPPEL